MGIKDLLRSRSKSRSRTSNEITQAPTQAVQSSTIADPASVPSLPPLRHDETSLRQSLDQSTSAAATAAAVAARNNAQTTQTSTASTPSSAGQHALRHEPDSANLKRDAVLSSTDASSTSRTGRSRAVSDLNKPLPSPNSIPNTNQTTNQSTTNAATATGGSGGVQGLTDRFAPMSLQDDRERQTQAATPRSQVTAGKQAIYDGTKPMLVQAASQAPDLTGIVDLTNTEDTTVDTTIAPAVVHETIRPHTHYIRHKEITREIHTHETFHRRLPVVDVQVLPARHFVPSKEDPNVLEEVTAEELPHSATDRYNNKHWVIAETISEPPDAPLRGPRQFTATTFKGTEGDNESWVGEDGVPRTKSTWVHPPTIDDTLQKEGKTMAVEIP